MSVVTPTVSRPAVTQTIAHSFLRRREVPVGAALLFVLIGTSIANHRFLSSQGRTDLMLAAAITGMVAIGETFVLLMRKVDLSVGSTLGLAAYAAGTAIKDGGDGQLVKAFAVGIAVGLCVGLFNGLLIALLDLPALVVTLGTLYVVAGIQAKIVGGSRITTDHLPADFVSFGVDRFLGIPKLMWIVLVVGAIASVFLRQIRSGRDLYAVGSNPPAAVLVGIPVRLRTLLAYLVCRSVCGRRRCALRGPSRRRRRQCGGRIRARCHRSVRRRRRQHLRRLRHRCRGPARRDAAALDRLLAERVVDPGVLAAGGQRRPPARGHQRRPHRDPSTRPIRTTGSTTMKAAEPLRMGQVRPRARRAHADRRQLLERQVPDDEQHDVPHPEHRRDHADRVLDDVPDHRRRDRSLRVVDRRAVELHVGIRVAALGQHPPRRCERIGGRRRRAARSTVCW